MTWIDFLWPLVTGVCITMALVHLASGLRGASRQINLLFAFIASMMAFYSINELGVIQSNTPEEYLSRLRWQDLSAAVIAISLTLFVWLYFRTGRRWLGILAISVMTLSVIPDLGPTPKLVFLELTELRTVTTIGGATFTVAEGVNNPWNPVYYLGVLLLMAFVVDASIAYWRLGQRRRSVLIGGTVVLIFSVAGGHGYLVDEGILQLPYFVSITWLFILWAMAWELGNDQLRVVRLAKELKESQERMAMAAQATELGFWEWDLVRDEMWATEKSRAPAGVSEPEGVSMERYIQTIHPDDRKAVKQALLDAAKQGSEFDAEFRVINPAGEIVWLSARSQVEHGADGKPLRMLGVTIDVTDRKRVEAELQRQRDELAFSQRVSAMGQLASALAHELSQPLGAILRNAEAAALFLQKDPPDVAEVREILTDIQADEFRAASVIDRIRSLLKRRDLSLESIPVDELIRGVLQLLQGEMQARHTTAHLDLPAEALPVAVDRVLVQQVILNLAINGLDAMEAVPEEDRQLVFRALPAEGGLVEVAVTDRGAGVPPERWPHLFQAFSTTKEKGTGIGLAISKTIVESHGGTIWAENNASGGSTFTFTLKAAEHGPRV